MAQDLEMTAGRTMPAAGMPHSEQSKWFDLKGWHEIKSGHRLITPDFPVLPAERLIFVEEMVEREFKKGNLIVVQGQEKPLQVARVLAVCAPFRTASGQMHQPPYLPGQTIFYAQYSGRRFEIDGIELIALTESEILGVKNTTAGKETE